LFGITASIRFSAYHISDTSKITDAAISTVGAEHAFWLTEVPGSATPEPEAEAEALSLLIFGLIGLTASRQLNPRRATRFIMSQNI
jgi:hypothetical protein